MGRSIGIAVVLATSLARAAFADDLTPERIAEIRHEEDKAVQKVNEAHGNKAPADLDSDERSEIAHEQSEATQRVLDKNHIDEKDFISQSMHLDREQLQQVQTATQAIADKEAAEKEAAGKKAAEEKKATAEKKSDDVGVQRGISDQNPVMLEGEDYSPEEKAAAAQAQVAVGDSAARTKAAAKKPNSQGKRKKKTAE